MLEKNVLITPGRGFGLPGYFRISYTIPEEKIKRAMPLFAKAIQELQ